MLRSLKTKTVFNEVPIAMAFAVGQKSKRQRHDYAQRNEFKI